MLGGVLEAGEEPRGEELRAWESQLESSVPLKCARVVHVAILIL